MQNIDTVLSNRIILPAEQSLYRAVEGSSIGRVGIQFPVFSHLALWGAGVDGNPPAEAFAVLFGCAVAIGTFCCHQ